MFHVLVIDDDKNIRYVLKEILETSQYTVFVAEIGEKAFDVLVKEHVDLVIVDIMMPCMVLASTASTATIDTNIIASILPIYVCINN